MINMGNNEKLHFLISDIVLNYDLTEPKVEFSMTSQFLYIYPVSHYL